MICKFRYYNLLYINCINYNHSPIRQEDNVLVYIEPKRDFIFVDAMRNKYGKMNYQELQACIMPNKFNYVYQETLPIFIYIPNSDCEATLIHPLY